MPAAEPVVSAAGGLARRRDLAAAGVSRRALARALREGVVRQLAPHVLGCSEQVDELPLRTAVLATGGVVSHQDAARLWGIELVEPAEGMHVTADRNTSRRRHAGTTVHRRALVPADLEERHGLRVTGVVRTLLDLCRSLPVEQAVAAVDSALRQGLCTLAELSTAHAAATRGPGRPRVTHVLALADPASGSVLESLFRVLVLLAGLAPPQSQFSVRSSGRLLARVDFAWPEQRLVVETDGFAFHADRERYRSDRRRTNALVLAGWRVLRFSWEDVRWHPDRVLAELQAALVG